MEQVGGKVKEAQEGDEMPMRQKKGERMRLCHPQVEDLPLIIARVRDILLGIWVVLFAPADRAVGEMRPDAFQNKLGISCVNVAFEFFQNSAVSG